MLWGNGHIPTQQMNKNCRYFQGFFNCHIFSFWKFEYVILSINQLQCTIWLPFSNITWIYFFWVRMILLLWACRKKMALLVPTCVEPSIHLYFLSQIIMFMVANKYIYTSTKMNPLIQTSPWTVSERGSYRSSGTDWRQTSMFGNGTPTVPTIDITSGTETKLAPHVSVNPEGCNKLEL